MLNSEDVCGEVLEGNRISSTGAKAVLPSYARVGGVISEESHGYPQSGRAC